LRWLAELPPSPETPYLTLTLDWRPQGTNPNLRPGAFFVDQKMDDFFESTGFDAHTPEYESLNADIEKVRSFLENEVDPAVQGLLIIACSAKNVFETILLGLPLGNSVTLAPTPALRVLAKLLEDEPRFTVLAADQEYASITVVDRAVGLYQLEVEATGFPRHQNQGGWSQRRYQIRADERVNAFARTVTEYTQTVMKDAGAEYLVLVGNEQLTTTLRDDLHPTFQERIAGMIKVDRLTDDNQVISAALPVVEEAERQAEANVIGRIANGAGPGGGAVTGVEETLAALQAQQVMTLVMNDDFTADGWADYSLPVFGLGAPPSEHPAGGDPSSIVPVRLEEELVRLAVQVDAEIEIVRTVPPISEDESANDLDGGIPRTEAASRLDEFGGVGAILRYALTEDQSTADLSTD